MGVTQVISNQINDYVLAESARQRRKVVLTHQGPSGWRLIKAVFAEVPSPPQRVAIQLPPTAEPGDLDRLVPGAALGCTFRVGHKKCLFNTVVDSRDLVNETVTLYIRRPDQLQQLQRRAYERVAPPTGSVIAVRFWREESGQESASTSHESRNVRHGQLEDVSAGGMRIKAADTQNMELDAAFRCVFTTGVGKPAFVLEALLHHREAADHGRASLGFQFVGLEITPEGRRTLDRLARLVNHFHRSRQRRRTKDRPGGEAKK